MLCNFFFDHSKEIIHDWNIFKLNDRPNFQFWKENTNGGRLTVRVSGHECFFLKSVSVIDLSIKNNGKSKI